MTGIYSVEKVTLTSNGNGSYTVHAVGQVPTGGWKKPCLVSRSGIVGGDGTLDFDFRAEKPTGMVTQAFQAIDASAQIGGPGLSLDGLRVVRVFDARGGHASAHFRPC